MEIARVLPPPFPLTFPLAGHLAFRLRAELLVVGITRVRPEPNPTVRTLSQTFRTHRPLPDENREEYDNHAPLTQSFARTIATAAASLSGPKKEENDPFGSRKAEKKTPLSGRRKKSHFRAASRQRLREEHRGGRRRLRGGS